MGNSTEYEEEEEEEEEGQKGIDGLLKASFVALVFPEPIEEAQP